MIKHDKSVALFFGVLTTAFIVLMTNETFFNWAFARHQNQLSWYLRPLFLIPFCYFAYRKSFAGISISIFALLTSMFWFPQPEEVSEEVINFLNFERQYLTSNWSYLKIVLASTVPLSLFLLALSFWKRNLWFGLTVIVLMAVGKLVWSIQNAGEAGRSIIIPAIVGLIICAFLVIYGYKKKSDD